jgi:hypothetical protein
MGVGLGFTAEGAEFAENSEQRRVLCDLGGETTSF